LLRAGFEFFDVLRMPVICPDMSNPKLMLTKTRFENQNEHGGNENARGRFPARAVTVSDDVNVRLICPTCQTAMFKSF